MMQKAYLVVLHVFPWVILAGFEANISPKAAIANSWLVNVLKAEQSLEVMTRCQNKSIFCKQKRPLFFLRW